ncbi:aspartoacylase [Crocosphaera chwakensis]|uniref:Probable aspartoacylase n=1 Tax=Crocosphaera chwakensis CCY0110 TaxID=391612 RepID=A3IRX0_9CHRO|nr:aspartoacylase [Crocosphaera chwakensis]EAZ90821.1 aspartoacylase [Crocosphaera chwakensis CCY0110]
MVKPIENVAIFGGTHGNEMTGIYLVKKFLKNPHLLQRKTLKVFPFLSNPKAIELGIRYTEIDLNRCFALEDIENLDNILYEQLLAKTIHQKLRTNQINFLVDIHSTTSAMGLTIILSDKNDFHLKLCSYLSLIHPEVKVLYYVSKEKNQLLRSNTELGLTVEVGAIPQGVLEADLFMKTEKVIYSLLDYLDKYNQNKIEEKSHTLIIYEVFERIDYPRNKEEITAMIHPNLQSKDYQPINIGDPLFMTFDGETITYQGDSTVYPVFINESAYYEKAIAMCLTKKREITLNHG